jgi:hypothetical protein
MPSQLLPALLFARFNAVALESARVGDLLMHAGHPIPQRYEVENYNCNHGSCFSSLLTLLAHVARV